MGDGSLSQEEIDQLLKGADDFSGGASPTEQANGGLTGSNGELSMDDSRQISQIMTHSLQAGIPGLGAILGKDARLGEPFTEVKSSEELQREYGNNFAVLTQVLSGVIQGKVGFVLSASDAAQISSAIMSSESGGAAGTGLDSAQMATIKEAIAPIMYAGITQLSVKMGTAVNSMPAEIIVTPQSPYPLGEESLYLRISFPLKIEGVVDCRIHYIMPTSIAKSVLRQISSARPGMPQGAMNMAAMGGGMSPQVSATGIKDVTFPQLNISGMGPQSPNMNLLMDVQMSLTVELGRTRMYIKEILSLGEGSIIELDKLAGEPVDLLVNGKLIAKGEVVVIDENFGVRVTDIVSPVDRLRNTKMA